MSENKIVRCAIYTRKSHEEGLDQAFNSLDAQRESAENYIASQKMNGWVCLPERYDDGGFTGGNMERPALKHLLSDVESGLIDVVVLYKIDRLSRSLIDFMKIVDVFNKSNVSFVSVTQHFSTTDSAGRMMLNILMTFAQYEREIIGERIRDKIAGAKRRGKYCGGPAILGYDGDSEEKKLVINKDEAEIVRFIFQRFLQLGSGKKLACELNESGRLTKAWTSRKGVAHGARKWNASQLYRMFRSPVYAGLVRHGDNLFPGEHEAIIERKQWEEIQTFLTQNQRRKSGEVGSRLNAPFQGVLKCGHCGGSMGLTYTAKKKGAKRYSYYLCMADYKRAESVCPVKRVAAGDLEKVILAQLGAVFRTPSLIAKTWLLARDQMRLEHDEISARHTELRADLAEARASGDKEKLQAVARELIDVSAQMKAFSPDSFTEQDVVSALQNMESLWDELFPAERQRLIRTLVEKIEVRKDGIDITLKTEGMSSLAAEFAALETEAI